MFPVLGSRDDSKRWLKARRAKILKKIKAKLNK